MYEWNENPAVEAFINFEAFPTEMIISYQLFRLSSARLRDVSVTQFHYALHRSAILFAPLLFTESLW